MADVVHRGRVVDGNGKPLYQAHIISLLRTPRIFAVTDQNGYFTVKAPAETAFEITHIGYDYPRGFFKLERFMKDATYRMVEQVHQLDEVVVSPRNPAPSAPKPKRDSSWLGDIFGAVGDIFGNGGQVMNTPPFRTTEIKVPTITNPIFIPNPTIGNSAQPGRQYVPPVTDGREDGNGITEWVKNNSLAAGGILFALIVGGSMLLKKNGNVADVTV